MMLLALLQRLPPTPPMLAPRPSFFRQNRAVIICFIWEFDYHFTNYIFRKTFDLFQNILPEG